MEPVWTAVIVAAGCLALVVLLLLLECLVRCSGLTNCASSTSSARLPNRFSIAVSRRSGCSEGITNGVLLSSVALVSTSSRPPAAPAESDGRIDANAAVLTSQQPLRLQFRPDYQRAKSEEMLRRIAAGESPHINYDETMKVRSSQLDWLAAQEQKAEGEWDSSTKDYLVTNASRRLTYGSRHGQWV